MESDDRITREAEAAADEAGRIGGEVPADFNGHDPAERPVREGGGGEAEGFEQAEEALIDHAAHGDLGHSPRHDAFAPEAESARASAEYGEADHEDVSEHEESDEDA